MHKRDKYKVVKYCSRGASVGMVVGAFLLGAGASKAAIIAVAAAGTVLGGGAAYVYYRYRHARVDCRLNVLLEPARTRAHRPRALAVAR
ncbi:MAG TPA: hypothetical protein PKE26_05120 [Kiritimatiellia bacterium]|nr:hypothetical protein [Kiritimatiellia bacterium]HMO98473.1 hypothetical protein [Kiritimatiellia bacterium]HMP96516.1 hypothetical protein [Kiritimatiellia bacterium]